jgi:hypothetical protein
MEVHRVQLLENGALLKALGVREREGGNVPCRGALLFAILAKYYNQGLCDRRRVMW